MSNNVAYRTSKDCLVVRRSSEVAKWSIADFTEVKLFYKNKRFPSNPALQMVLQLLNCSWCSDVVAVWTFGMLRCVWWVVPAAFPKAHIVFICELPKRRQLFSQGHRVTNQNIWTFSNPAVIIWHCRYCLPYFFKVCKSVHHRTIQINHQPDATVFQFIIQVFIYSWTCFGRFPGHHQELNDCSGSLWFYLRIVVIVVLRSWSGRLGCHCSHWAPDDGRENARNMLSCK